MLFVVELMNINYEKNLIECRFAVSDRSSYRLCDQNERRSSFSKYCNQMGNYFKFPIVIKRKRFTLEHAKVQNHRGIRQGYVSRYVESRSTQMDETFVKRCLCGCIISDLRHFFLRGTLVPLFCFLDFLRSSPKVLVRIKFGRNRTLNVRLWNV